MFTFADLLAMHGVPVKPENAIQWGGCNPDVQTKPDASRDHSAAIREKVRGIDERKRGASKTEETENWFRSLAIPVLSVPRPPRGAWHICLLAGFL
jgi:hypothetical protein